MTNDPLVGLNDEWTTFAGNESSATDDFMRRISGRFVSALTREIAETLLSAGAHVVSRRSAAPDLLATSGPDARPLGVEITTWRNSRKNARNQFNQAISTSVNARRAISSNLTLDLIVVLLPTADDADWTREEEVVSRAENLLRSDDGVGFDNVMIGLVGPFSRWIIASRTGRRDLADFEGVKTAITDGLRQMPELRHRELPTTPTALLVGDEWGSGLGGISTFNRSLAIGLAANGFNVGMLLPSFESDEVDEASAGGVGLYSPDRIPGIAGVSALLAPATYPEDFQPDLIVGHGRKLGSYAFAVQKNQFPTAKRLHIVHTHAEALEAVKGHPLDEPIMISTEQKRRLEIELAQSAELVAGVGPLLTQSIRQVLRGSVQQPEVFEVVPELPKWVDGAPLPLDPPPSSEILIVGRTEDLESKGIEFAVRAMSLANAQLIAAGIPSATLAIRGVLPADEPALRARLSPLLTQGKLTLRPYSSIGAELRTDFFAATTVLLPSLHEGFGLSAFEAIGVGVPVLVSAKSGLGELLQRTDPAATEVLPIDDATEAFLLTTWANAIVNNIKNSESAFIRAAELRALIADRYSWARVAADLKGRL